MGECLSSRAVVMAGSSSDDRGRDDEPIDVEGVGRGVRTYSAAEAVAAAYANMAAERWSVAAGTDLEEQTSSADDALGAQRDEECAGDGGVEQEQKQEDESPELVDDHGETKRIAKITRYLKEKELEELRAKVGPLMKLMKEVFGDLVKMAIGDVIVQLLRETADAPEKASPVAARATTQSPGVMGEKLGPDDIEDVATYVLNQKTPVKSEQQADVESEKRDLIAKVVGLEKMIIAQVEAIDTLKEEIAKKQAEWNQVIKKRSRKRKEVKVQREEVTVEPVKEQAVAAAEQVNKDGVDHEPLSQSVVQGGYGRDDRVSPRVGQHSRGVRERRLNLRQLERAGRPGPVPEARHVEVCAHSSGGGRGSAEHGDIGGGATAASRTGDALPVTREWLASPNSCCWMCGAVGHHAWKRARWAQRRRTQSPCAVEVSSIEVEPSSRGVKGENAMYEKYVSMVATTKNRMNIAVGELIKGLGEALDAARLHLVDSTDGAVEWRRQGRDVKCYYVEEERFDAILRRGPCGQCSSIE